MVPTKQRVSRILRKVNDPGKNNKFRQPSRFCFHRICSAISWLMTITTRFIPSDSVFNHAFRRHRPIIIFFPLDPGHEDEKLQPITKPKPISSYPCTNSQHDRHLASPSTCKRSAKRETISGHARHVYKPPRTM